MEYAFLSRAFEQYGTHEHEADFRESGKELRAFKQKTKGAGKPASVVVKRRRALRRGLCAGLPGKGSRKFGIHRLYRRPHAGRQSTVRPSADKTDQNSARSNHTVRGSRWRRHREHHSAGAGRGFVATRSGRCSDVIRDTMSLVLRTSEEPASQRLPRHALLGLFRASVLCVTMFLAAASAHITIREKGKLEKRIETAALRRSLADLVSSREAQFFRGT
ncbi:hypothetical protein MTO96_008288 [Rhipicephalus appendiculatus]